MGFLRRLLGGGHGEPPVPDADEGAPDDEPGDGEPDGRTPIGGAPATDEQARERELLREEARRLDDDLIQRQMRYADRSWTPPAQGGTRRADDEEATRESRG